MVHLDWDLSRVGLGEWNSLCKPACLPCDISPLGHEQILLQLVSKFETRMLCVMCVCDVRGGKSNQRHASQCVRAYSKCRDPQLPPSPSTYLDRPSVQGASDPQVRSVSLSPAQAFSLLLPLGTNRFSYARPSEAASEGPARDLVPPPSPHPMSNQRSQDKNSVERRPEVQRNGLQGWL